MINSTARVRDSFDFRKYRYLNPTTDNGKRRRKKNQQPSGRDRDDENSYVKFIMISFMFLNSRFDFMQKFSHLAFKMGEKTNQIQLNFTLQLSMLKRWIDFMFNSNVTD